MTVEDPIAADNAPALRDALSRREFAALAAATGVAIATGSAPAAAQQRPTARTFTILHTNDLHSNLIGVGPASEYTLI